MSAVSAVLSRDGRGAWRPLERATWWPRGARRGIPVSVIQRLPVKVRVVDLAVSDHRRLVLRDVMPNNLTTKEDRDE